MGFQVIIAGGRDFADYGLLQAKCDQFFREKRPTAIISGIARGADTLGTRTYDRRGKEKRTAPAGSPVLERRLIEKWQRGNNTHPWSSMRKSWAR